MHRRKDAIQDTYRPQRASTAVAAIGQVRRISVRNLAQNRARFCVSSCNKIHYRLHGAMFPVTLISDLLYQLFLDSDLRYFRAYFLRPSAVDRQGTKREETACCRQSPAEAWPTHARERMQLGQLCAGPAQAEEVQGPRHEAFSLRQTRHDVFEREPDGRRPNK
jgi:hypothetical protein